MLLSDVCPSVCHIRTSDVVKNRPRKTQIGTEIAHVTRDSDTILSRSKVHKSRSSGHFTQRGLNT